MAFLDGHVEHGSLWDWTLPVSAVWNHWHHSNVWPVDDNDHRLEGISRDSQMNYDPAK